MQNKKIINFSIIIPTLSLLVATIVLLFGNNIFDRLTGPKVVMQSNKSELIYPDNIVQALNQNNAQCIPDLYETIIIQNKGFISSKNITMQIKTGGQIIGICTYSTEEISDEKQIDNSTYKLELNRLSQNAYIKLNVWIKNAIEPISIVYADDYSSRQLVEESDDSYSTLKIIMIIVIIISLIPILRYIILNIMSKIDEYKTQRECDLFIKIADLINEKEAKTEEDMNSNDGTFNDEIDKDKLKELIKKAREI